MFLSREGVDFFGRGRFSLERSFFGRRFFFGGGEGGVFLFGVFFF